ncbi:PIG-L family deacetylase [Streptomyces sp. NPDC003077]|uniref:PIG-L family deacetylase n=1 Tax=Streptomyces sp. NPDC003077 TaxID=3154443 RepID=UPI0033AB11DC
MGAHPPSISRRRLLQAAGGGVAVACAGGGWWAWSGPDGDARRAGAEAVAAQAAYLHVIAHADDSLYFMNPDLEQSVRGGARSVTVCLTGGESDGRNAGVDTPNRHDVPADRAAFARARTNGLRAAHAEMATGDPASPWKVAAVPLLPGFEAEVHTLRAAPHHELIFLGLVESRAIARPLPVSLRGLWLGATGALPTLRPLGTPVRHAAPRSRAQVIASLVAVLERVRPTVVRTLDPNASHVPHPGLPADDPRLRGLLYYDHQDHIVSAYFAQAALAAYWQRPHAHPTVVEHYLGYETGTLPHNLDPAAARRKSELLSTYGWADRHPCADPAGCGDLKVGGTSLTGRSRNWTRSTRPRTPGSPSWLHATADGRLAAFAVLDGAAHVWAETEPGSGTFHGPYAQGGELLQGEIHALRQRDGRLRLFALRTVLPGRNRAHRRDLVTAVQNGTGPGGAPAFADWTSLGTPDADPARSLETGFPAAVETRDGALLVFVRDWSGGIGYRRRPRGGAWSRWRRLAGPVGTGGGVTAAGATARPPRVVDGLDACVDAAGLVHVAAPSAWAVHHWVSAVPGGVPLRASGAGLPAPAGPVSLAPAGDGTVWAAFRQPESARAVVAAWRGGGAGWRVADRPAPMGGQGRVAVTVAGGGRPVVAGRDGAGAVRVAVAGGPPGEAGGWRTGKVPHSAAAGIARDVTGRAVAVVLGHDGRLYAARQQDTGPGAAVTGWRAQGGDGRG